MTTYRRNYTSRRLGFTLVEILIVIVIIGMLAGLTTTVMVASRRSVSNALVSSQMAQLSIALDEYKNKYGEYPPDMSDRVAVERHIKKRWPRYGVGYDQFLEHVRYGCKMSSSDDIGPSASLSQIKSGNGRYVWDVDNYMSSLVFWLGGLPNADGVPSGFYMNPKAPLGIGSNDKGIRKPNRAQREKPLFQFDKRSLGEYRSASFNSNTYFYRVEDKSELMNSDWSAYCYEPGFCQGDYPVVYFKPSTNSGYAQKSFYLGETSADSDAITSAVPYAKEYGNSWYEEKRFQLVHPGADGMFGPIVNSNDPKEGERADYPATQPKANLYQQDADNIVNFVESGTLEIEYQE